MLTFVRCTGEDALFRALAAELDEDLLARYGAQMAFFGPHNKSAHIKTALVASLDGEPAGCGCFQPFSETAVEMKRVFVSLRFRGRGVGREMMAYLERWAREIGYRAAMVETGILQPEAIRLYEATGYERIPNYPPYEGVKESVCFQKSLI
ncbi:MAG: GNAT family N-acetyltransferase [Christensenella sp.]|nr:GNAT family N-acetyltransferase [Christensenella sp.]